MFQMILIGAVILTVGCSGITVNSYPLWISESGSTHEYRVVELYANNLVSPSYVYHLLYHCRTIKGAKRCDLMNQNPTIQPGAIYSVLPAMIQAGGIVGAGALVGSGLSKSGSQTSVSNTGSSHSQAVDGGAGNDIITVNP